MLDALIDLGKIPQAETDQKDKEKEPKIPDEVENLFSVMDFANDNKISEKEFLRATLHYRRLGNLLSIDYLEKCRQEIVRKIKALVDDVKKEGCSSTCGLVLTVKELS